MRVLFAFRFSPFASFDPAAGAIERKAVGHVVAVGVGRTRAVLIVAGVATLLSSAISRKVHLGSLMSQAIGEFEAEVEPEVTK